MTAYPGYCGDCSLGGRNVSGSNSARPLCHCRAAVGNGSLVVRGWCACCVDPALVRPWQVRWGRLSARGSSRGTILLFRHVHVAQPEYPTQRLERDRYLLIG